MYTNRPSGLSRLLPLLVLAACADKQDTGSGDTSDTSGGSDTGSESAESDSGGESGADSDTGADTGADSDTSADTDTDTSVDTGGDTGGAGPGDALVGRAWSYTPADGTFTDPAGIGSVIAPYITMDMLIGVTGSAGTLVEMSGAVAIEGSRPAAQDPCRVTADYADVDFAAAPQFTTGPADGSFPFDGYELSITGTTVSGVFSADGSRIDDLVITGAIDTRPLAVLVDDSGNPGAVCELVVSFGVACVACAADGEPYCLDVTVKDLTAVEVPDPVVSVTSGC